MREEGQKTSGGLKLSNWCVSSKAESANALFLENFLDSQTQITQIVYRFSSAARFLSAQEQQLLRIDSGTMPALFRPTRFGFSNLLSSLFVRQF